jgi:hypothetical protein
MSAAIERRASVRKIIRMQCVARFSSGLEINGITKNISLTGVEVEASAISGATNEDTGPG